MTTLRKLSIILTASMAIISTSCRTAHTAASGAQSKTGIVAHRGFWNCEEAGYARNSVAALKCAQDAGFWGSEFDVNMTSDGELIVYHDSDVEGKKIEKHPYSEFKDFKLENGENIPTIDQYLEQGKKSKTVLVYELKPHSCAEVEDRFVEITLRKLKEHNLLNPKRVIFISFSSHMCEVLARKCPGFTVQFLSFPGKNPEKVNKLGINGIDYHFNAFNLNKKWIEEAHALNMSTNAWTVNDVKDMRKMLELGVNYLTTDDPLDARELMKEMKIKEVR